MAMGTVRVLCGAEKERVVATHKALGECPRCGGAVVAIDVESERRIHSLPLCVKVLRRRARARQ
ncbi:hypothetical protein PVAP13_2NG004600 [Panicum virgatum]|uniref:Uncharacterized protein n=1 Tax=Panicum virgatum TaxID=38727 RepID=A0A8T0VHI4_PANVG|nr:hypothetical protein PVAP13_2NG004600 [Panicum virgatum]